jgi:hypothetical protein
MEERRHTCIICKKKRYESKMKKVLVNSWACRYLERNMNSYCYEHKEIKIGEKILEDLKKFKIIKIKHFQ